MQTFERHFRDEQEYLKNLAELVATEHPELKEFIGPHSGDAFVERIFEVFSLLSSQFKLKLKDSFPEITYEYLTKVWGFPLRPIPASTIIQVSNVNDVFTEFLTVPKFTRLLHENKTKDKSMTFITSREISLCPISIIQRKLYKSVDKSSIVLTCRYEGKSFDYSKTMISFYLGNEISTANTLKLWLEQYLTHINLTCSELTQTLHETALKIDSPSLNNLVIPVENEQNWPLQAFIEGLYLPHLYDFIHLEFSANNSQLISDNETTFNIVFNFDGAIPIDGKHLQDAFFLQCVPAINIENDHSENVAFLQSTNTYKLEFPQDCSLYALDKISAINSPVRQFSEKYDFQTLQEYHPRYRLFSEDDRSNAFYKLTAEVSLEDEINYFLDFFDGNSAPLENFKEKGFNIYYRFVKTLEEHLSSGSITSTSLMASDGITATNICETWNYYPPMVRSDKHWPIISYLSLSPLFLNDLDLVKRSIVAFALHGDLDIRLKRRVDRLAQSLDNLSTEAIDRIVGDRIRRGFQMEITLDPKMFNSEGDMYSFSKLLLVFFSNTITENSFILLKIINKDNACTWQLPQMKGQRKTM